MATLRFRKGYVDAPTGQVHYRMIGDGDPLVLVHMAPSSSMQFEAAYPILRDAGFRVIGVDLPGYGMSDPPEFVPTIADYATAVLAVLDGLGIASCPLVGHHTGARTVCHIAISHPERVSRLVFQGSGVFAPEERERLLASVQVPTEPLAADGSHFIRQWERRSRATPGWTSAPAMQRALLARYQAGETVWHAHHAAFTYDLESAIRAIAVPTLQITNTGDPIYPHARKTHEIRPDFAYVELEGGTHDIVDEQPEAWTGAIIAFLRQATS